MINYFILLKIQNTIDIKKVLLHWFINFFDKKLSAGSIKNENMPDPQSAEELLKTIIREFEKRKVLSCR